MFYRNILKKSFYEITWKNKYLWFFGFFALFLGGSGELGVILKTYSGSIGKNMFLPIKQFLSIGLLEREVWSNFFPAIKSSPGDFAILLSAWLIVLILFAFFIWLAVISQVALVNNSAKIISNKKTTLKDGVFSGLGKFWQVLGLNIFIKATIFISLVLVGLPTFFQYNFVLINWLYVLLFIIFVSLAVILSLIFRYAIAYIVIKSENFTSSIKQAWRLFIENWLVSVEMAVILFAISILAYLAALLAGFLLIAFVLFLALLLGQYLAAFLFWPVLILGGLGVLLIFFAIQASITTFYISSWTILFIELAGKKGSSKIIRLVEDWNK